MFETSFFRCDLGLDLVGGEERVCGPLGDWSGQPPVCVNSSQTCLAPQLLSSGHPAYDGWLEVGSRAWYECREQFSPVGPWPGRCGTDDCPACHRLASPEHGSVTGGEAGAALQFSCRPGYLLAGAAVLTCPGPAWSAPPPVCVPALCPEPEPLPGGRVRGAARRVGDSVRYECGAGFSLLGVRVRVCGLEGKWTGQPPHCAAITCPALPALLHGHTEPGQRVPGERARFRCR